MLTNDVKGLAARAGRAAPPSSTPTARSWSLLVVYALEDRVLIELPAELTEKTLADHRPLPDLGEGVLRGGRRRVRDPVGAGARRARGLLEGVAGAALELAPYAHAEVTIAGAPVRVINRARGGRRRASTAGRAAEHAAALRSALARPARSPSGDETLEVLRIEAGQPWYPPRRGRRR